MATNGSNLGLFQIIFQDILARRAKMSWKMIWKIPRFEPSKNVLKNYLKKPKICPIMCQSDPICGHHWHPWFRPLPWVSVSSHRPTMTSRNEEISKSTDLFGRFEFVWWEKYVKGAKRSLSEAGFVFMYVLSLGTGLPGLYAKNVKLIKTLNL